MSNQSKDSLSEKNLWIGLAQVKQSKRNGALGNADQAYVNVLTLALNKADFIAQLQEELSKLNLIFIKLKDAETMQNRLSKHSLHEDLHDLAEDVVRTGALRFDVFCTFDLEH